MGTKSCCSLLSYINICCLGDKAKIALFQNYFDIRPPGQTPGQTPGKPQGRPRADPRADPRAKLRSANPTPEATKVCESPGVAWGGGGGMVRLGID